MEYKQVVTHAIRWVPEKVGEYLEGIYMGSEEAESQYGVYDRFLIQVKEKTYWVYNASMRELYRRLDPVYAKRGCKWKIVCVAIDDFSMPDKRICTFELHAGDRVCRVA